jgi:RNA polymerase sigma-70 factor (ECF subfamily)
LKEIVENVIDEKPKFSNPFDEEFIKGIKSGDRKTISEFFNYYQPYLTNKIFGLKTGLTDEEIEDLVSEGIMHCIRNINKYSGTGSFNGWVMSVVRNLMLTMIQKKKQRQERLPSKSMTDVTDRFSIADIFYDESEKMDLNKKLQLFFNTLSDKESKFLKLKLSGMKNQEIADVMGLSLGTSKWYTNNLLEKYKTFIKKNPSLDTNN